MTETEAFLILNAIPGVGNRGIRKLLEIHGSACNVLNECQKDSIVQFAKEEFLKRETESIRKSGLEILTISDGDYPEQLQEIPDAPIVLYVKGAIPKNHATSIAMVGSRKASVYGTTTADQFASRFAELGFCVVSGMARGIDTAAHKGALRARGTTVAVLGCGFAHTYPPENKKLTEEIAANGAVISEFPFEMAPLAQNFPRRNRIISGLSMGTVVVEAAERSGALITVNFALEQGREVFAVPGKVDSPYARGVHKIIKEGAKLVTCVEDILEEFTLPLKAELDTAVRDVVSSEEVQHELTDQEQRIYAHVTERPIHIDELMNQCDEAIPTTMAVLLQLELKHMVRQLPGKMFQKARN